MWKTPDATAIVAAIGKKIGGAGGLMRANERGNDEDAKLKRITPN